MNLENEGYHLSTQIDSLYDENVKLRKQIEKMKCCENCKHRDAESINGWSGFGCQEHFKECGDFNDDENLPTYKYWEIKED